MTYTANTGGTRPVPRPLHVYLPAGIVTSAGLPVDEYRLCATEYTVDGATRGEDAMPADLPAASGYTMAVELEARNSAGDLLVAARPASPGGAVWIENTMGFERGTVVPAGSYDYGLGGWLSDADGRVLEISSACDITPSAVVSSAEQTALCDAFPLGGQVWRVPLEHFSTHDFNWPLNFNQTNLVPSLGWADRDLPDAPCTTRGSTIGCEDQSLGEDLPITGTPFGLHYSSDRQAGRHERYALDIDIPTAPEPTPPVVFQRVLLEIQVAGQRLRFRSDDPIVTRRPVAGQPFHLVWDGLDGWGRQTQGAQPITVRIGFAFTTDYLAAAVGSRSFALAGDTNIAVNVGSREVVLWRTRQSLIGGWDARGEELGGFSISAHHVYDARARTLYRGDGTRYSSPGIGEVIAPLGDSLIPGAISLAAAPDGTLYVGQQITPDRARIWRISREGHVEPFAGTGATTPVGVDVLRSVEASAATFRGAVALAVRRDGALLVTERAHHCVREVRDMPDGRRLVTWFAGACRPALGTIECTSIPGDPLPGDGGFATDAPLLCPRGLAVAPDGAVYIAELTAAASGAAERIRRVDPSGRIDTFATFNMGDLDGQLTTDREGRLLVLTAGRLRRITAFASTPSTPNNQVLLGRLTCGPSGIGDGGPGEEACIPEPTGVAVGPDGSVFVAHDTPGRIRRLGPSGIVTTIAGGGTSLAATGPARSAQLNFLRDVAVLPDGRVVIAQDGLGVRVVRSALPDVFVGQVVVPEPDGSLSHVFDERGRHLSTRHGLTGTVLLDFDYADGAAMGALEMLNEHVGTATALVTRIMRDASGPRAIVGPFGDRTALENSGGYLSRMTVPGGTIGEPRTWTFALGGEGLLTTFVDPLGSAWTSTFDPLSSGRLATETVPLGTRVVALTRQECGPTDVWCDAARGERGSRTEVTEGPGARQARALELVSTSWGGTRRRQVDALGAVTLGFAGIEPPPVGLPDPAVPTTLNAPLEHDGLPTEPVPVSLRVERSDGSTLRLATGIDPRPGLGEYVRAARFCRDAACGTATTSTVLRTTSPLTETITVNGTRSHTSSFEPLVSFFDCPGGRVIERSPLGREKRTCLDEFGRGIGLEASGMNPIDVSYDLATGGVTRIRQGGRQTRYSYVTSAGAPTAFVQTATTELTPSDLVLVLQRDAAGWITRSTLQATSWSVHVARDGRGDPTRLTLPNDEGHDFAFTALGAARQYVPPNIGTDASAAGEGETLESQFDPLHRPEMVVFRDGEGAEFGSITLNYDDRHGQLESIDVPAQAILPPLPPRADVLSIPERHIRLTYDTATNDADGRPDVVTGQLMSVDGPDGASLAFAYDGPLLASETWSGTVSGSVSRTIDAFLEVSNITVTTASGTSVPTLYTHDDDGNLTAAGAMTASTDLVVDSSVREHWERTTTMGPAGTPVSTTEVFDRFGELLSSSARWARSAYFTQVLRRDELGRVIEELDGGSTRRYDYDRRGWLLRVRGGTGTPTLATYTYDDNGNRLSATYGGVFLPAMGRLAALPGSASYDDQDRIKSYGGCTFGHDAVGHRVEQRCDGRMGSVIGTWRFAYDLLGNLIYAEQETTGARINYEVDGLGRRVRRVARNGGDRITDDRRWLYLDGLRPAAEFEVVRGVERLRWVFVWGTRENVPDYLVRGSDRAMFRLVTDVRGSVRSVVAVATGETMQWLAYDAFGFEIVNTTMRDFGDQPFRFAGGLWDSDTRMLHFGARDYDPVTARWLAKDPTLFDGGDTNLYGYCGNDPVNRIDPSGTDWKDWKALIQQSGWYLAPRNQPSSGWTYGTTNVGRNFAALGILAGGHADYVGNGEVVMTGHPFLPAGVTLGNVMCFPSTSPSERSSKHERAHLPQVRALGPVYLLAHAILQGASAVQHEIAPDPAHNRWHQSINFLETGPMSSPPRAWPWQ